jgi:peptidoglycan/xylan/chitin deacetylase (PgdA/CDA1 family)
MLVVTFLLTGCQQSNITSIKPNISNTSHMDTKELFVNPLAKGNFESGMPKEEPVILDSKLKQREPSNLIPIYSVGKGNVAITIDDGPTKYTNELLKVLEANKVKVTFFFVGQNVTAYPQAVTEAVYDGDVIGYHSNSHPEMTRLTLNEQEKEYDLGLTKLKKIDSNPITLFRPPYGAYNNDTKIVTQEHKMEMVLWNEDPRDWATNNPVVLAKNVLAKVRSGSIIVLHDKPSTISALPAIISGILKRKLKLVTIQAK